MLLRKSTAPNPALEADCRTIQLNGFEYNREFSTIVDKIIVEREILLKAEKARRILPIRCHCRGEFVTDLHGNN